MDNTLSERDNSATRIENQFALFSLCWALAILVHQFRSGLALTPAGVVLFMVCWWVVMNPRLLQMFILLCLVQVVEMWLKMPYPSNHSLIITFVNLTFLFTIGWLLVKKQKVTIAEVWQTAVPAIRLQVLALYFWAAVHKLNSDFFNPLVSCATTHKGLGHYAFLPQPEWLQWATIYGTVLLEGSLVLMLIFRRTRPFGIFLGLGFHFMLGIFDFHDFSSVMFCLLLLFAPHESAALFAKGQAWFQRIGWRFYWILPFILGSTYFAFRASFLPWPIYTISSAILQTIWVLLAITPLIWFVKIQWTAVQQGHYYQTKTLLQVKYKAILIVSLLAFLNGLTPYLGLKTELSYAMYSNLRTEGRQTNHFLIPTSWQLWDYQKDLVHITESDGGNLQYFMSNDYFLTYPLFQAEMNHSSASFVIYEHQGKTIELQSPFTLPPLRPQWMYNFLYFRPVDAQANVRCTH